MGKGLAIKKKGRLVFLTNETRQKQINPRKLSGVNSHTEQYSHGD